MNRTNNWEFSPSVQKRVKAKAKVGIKEEEKPKQVPDFITRIKPTPIPKEVDLSLYRFKTEFELSAHFPTESYRGWERILPHGVGAIQGYYGRPLSRVNYKEDRRYKTNRKVIVNNWYPISMDYLERI